MLKILSQQVQKRGLTSSQTLAQTSLVNQIKRSKQKSNSYLNSDSVQTFPTDELVV